MTQPRLQEISSVKPRYFSVQSIVSNVAMITTPHTDPTPATPAVVSASIEPAAKSDPEIVERPTEGERRPSSAFDTTNFNVARSRGSHTSGLLSIITLPSFISNDRSGPYSSSAGARVESPIQPNRRKPSSLFGQMFDIVPPTTPTDESAGGNTGKRSRPTSGALQLITSVLKRSGSTSPSVRSASPSPRRSLRRFPGWLNPSLSAEDEAAIEWKRLPLLPLIQGSPTIQASQLLRVAGVEEFPTERLPSYCEKDLKPPSFLAPHVPLPPSPSTMASSVSSLAYALPSPAEIPPINGFTTPYTSYPPPPIPSAHSPFDRPPIPRSAEKITDAHTIHATESTTSLADNTLRRVSDDVGSDSSNLTTPMTAAFSVFSGNSSGSLPYPPNGDEPRLSICRESTVSAFSQHSTILFPLPPLLTLSSSPPPPTSPRGPRPLPPGQRSRGRTLYSQTNSIGRKL